MKHDSDTPTQRRESPPMDAGRRVSTRPLLVVLIGFIGAPVAATTAIFVWYLTPIRLSASGSSAAEIGRVVMLYYLMLVVVGPLANSLFQRWQGAIASIITGLVITASTLFVHETSTTLMGYALAMIGLGVGHALIRTPLLTLVVKTAGSATGPVNVLRGAERLGGLIGLSAGGFLLSRGMENLALSALAGLSVAGVLLLTSVHTLQR